MALHERFRRDTDLWFLDFFQISMEIQNHSFSFKNNHNMRSSSTFLSYDSSGENFGPFLIFLRILKLFLQFLLKRILKILWILDFNSPALNLFHLSDVTSIFFFGMGQNYCLLEKYLISRKKLPYSFTWKFLEDIKDRRGVMSSILMSFSIMWSDFLCHKQDVEDIHIYEMNP